jgi:hypothetical protein
MTWAPSSFDLIAQAAVEDAFGMETALHAMLAHRRVEARREFFELTHAEARALFNTVALLSGPREALEFGVPGETGEYVESGAGRPGASSEDKLRAWVESKYTHMELRDKDRGTKLEALHSAYMRARPPVHTRQLGKINFARMLSTVYPGIGPHKNGACTVSGLYLLR